MPLIKRGHRYACIYMDFLALCRQALVPKFTSDDQYIHPPEVIALSPSRERQLILWLQSYIGRFSFLSHNKIQAEKATFDNISNGLILNLPLDIQPYPLY